MDDIDQRLDRIARHPFRAKFHLRGRERATMEIRGLSKSAETPATWSAAGWLPRKDGKQTPYRGHPVYVTQHATPTCCRTCLLRWHQILEGSELTPNEQDYIVTVICRWITGELQSRSPL